MGRSRTTFQPGQVTNPGGRPKAIKDVQDLARKYTPDAIKTLAEICVDKKAYAGARVAAATAILDRGYGRPAQHTTIDATISLENLVTNAISHAAMAAIGNGEDVSDDSEAITVRH